MDKFLLAHNPLRPGAKDIFIIHLLEPVAIMQVHAGKLETGAITKTGITSKGEWTLSFYHIEELPFTVPDEEKRHLLERAWRWYKAFIENPLP